MNDTELNALISEANEYLSGSQHRPTRMVRSLLAAIVELRGERDNLLTTTREDKGYISRIETDLAAADKAFSSMKDRHAKADGELLDFKANTKWEYPSCGIDEFGAVYHSVNCECYGPSGKQWVKRQVMTGPWVPWVNPATPSKEQEH